MIIYLWIKLMKDYQKLICDLHIAWDIIFYIAHAVYCLMGDFGDYIHDYRTCEKAQSKANK